jgi:hypothetical protein
VGNEGFFKGVAKKMSLAKKVAGFYCCEVMKKQYSIVDNSAACSDRILEA